MTELLGDYRTFFALQKTRLARLDIDVSKFGISHLAFRTETYEDYLELRDRIEEHCVANIENVWNGRPISKLLLKTPLELDTNVFAPLIELIPPVHERAYKMGLEHIGFVLGDDIDEFGRQYRSSLAGQQFQSATCEPYYVKFDDHTHAKFYRQSLGDVCAAERGGFDGFCHVSDWPDTASSE